MLKQTKPSFYSKCTCFEYSPHQNQKTWAGQTAESPKGMLSYVESGNTGTILTEMAF